MKRKTVRKLELARETLRHLQKTALEKVGGADGTWLRTECGSCPASECHPTECSPPCAVTEVC